MNKKEETADITNTKHVPVKMKLTRCSTEQILCLLSLFMSCLSNRPTVNNKQQYTQPCNANNY